MEKKINNQQGQCKRKGEKKKVKKEKKEKNYMTLALNPKPANPFSILLNAVINSLLRKEPKRYPHKPALSHGSIALQDDVPGLG